MKKKVASESHDLEAIIRELVTASGKTIRAICDEAEISPSQLSYFMREERTLTLDTASRLARVLGFTISKV